MAKGILFVVSGPSGCGKGTVLERIVSEPNIWCSVSATTREPRPGEKDGVNYFFLTIEEFERRIREDEILEYARYCDHYYGTPRQSVEEHLSRGDHVILEIEVEGARKVRTKCPEAVSIFLMPPSVEELSRRLHKRGTESEDVISARVAQAQREMECAAEYEYIVVNDKLEDAVADVRAIIRAEQCRTARRDTNRREEE